MTPPLDEAENHTIQEIKDLLVSQVSTAEQTKEAVDKKFAELSTKMDHQGTTLDDVRIQTTRTNGRVVALEQKSDVHQIWLSRLEERVDGSGVSGGVRSGSARILQLVVIGVVMAIVGAALTLMTQQ